MTKNEKPVGRWDRNFDDFCTETLCFLSAPRGFVPITPGIFVRRIFRTGPILIGFCLFCRPFGRDFGEIKGYYLILKYSPGTQLGTRGRLS